MTPAERYLLSFLGVVVVAVAFGVVYRKDLIQKQWFLDKHLLERGLNRPNLWLFYPSSEVNSRVWMDAGARSSRALNIPVLNLTYETIVAQHKDDYHIRVIGGVSGVADLLGEEALPSGLRRFGDLASLGEAEMDWIRSAVLAEFGGLWLSPTTVCLRGFGELPKDKVVFFGTNPDETYAGPNGTSTPGKNALWVPRAKHPMLVEWEQVCFQRVDEKRGGEQIRRDWNWDYSRFASEYASLGVEVDPHCGLTRKKNGKRIQLEDLLAAGTEGQLPFDVQPHTVYVPLPWRELQDREVFGWVLRMSEQQVMESDIVLRYLLEAGLRPSGSASSK